MKIKKSELKQMIKESVKQVLREGAGSAYDLKIDGLCVDKINILHNNEKGKVGFTATLKSGDVEWLAEDYYDRVSSDGIYYDGDLVMDYDNSQKRINGGKIKGYFYIDEFEDDIRQDEYDKNDMIRFLKDVLTDFKITNTIGGGYSYTKLEKDIVFHNTEVEQNWSNTTIHVDEMLINAPEISEAINWFFENCYKFDEIFGNNEDEELIREVDGERLFVKNVECYDENDNIVFVAVISPSGSDSYAIKSVNNKFPNLDVVDVTDVDGYIDYGNMSPGQYKLFKQKAIMLDDALNSVKDLDDLDN